MLFKMSRLAFYCSVGLLCLVNSNVFAGQTTIINIPTKGIHNPTPQYPNKPPRISANGRYVVFSILSDMKGVKTSRVLDRRIIGRLLPSVQKLSVFIYDSQTGKTETVNTSWINNRQWGFFDSAISADGRYVVFSSKATNLVKGDSNQSADVFIYDRLTRKIERVSIASNGTQGNKNSGYAVSISADNRYIAFNSLASNLVNNDTNQSLDVFVHDRTTHKTERVNISSSGVQANVKNSNDDIDLYELYYSDVINLSADGRYVAFESLASNLVAEDTNKATDIFVRDRLTQKTERISFDETGKQRKEGSHLPTISANGRYISYLDNSGFINIHDRLTHKTQASSIGSTYFGTAPVLSSDGRYIAFNASFIPGFEFNGDAPFYVTDWLKNKTEKVSVNLDGYKSQSNHGGGSIPTAPSMSADGRYIVFKSYSDLGGRKNDLTEPAFYVRDRLLDTKHHADLTITPTTKPATLKPNTQGTYLYTITNNGKDSVPDVSLIHLVSGGSAVSFKSSQGKCSFSPVETVCHLGKLAAGKKLTLSVTVRAQNKAFSQQVTVNGAPVDAVPANNQVSVVTSAK